MTAVPVEPDGDLSGALEKLRDGVSALTDPKLQIVEGRKEWAEPLYASLCDAVESVEGSGVFMGVAKSQPPIWTDAFDLRNEIDVQVKTWQPDPGVFDGDLTRPPTPETVRRLRILESLKTWRPQDTKTLDGYSNSIENWCNRINHLLNPEPVKTVSAPCPACQKRWVYRRDSSGENVRQPALQLTAQGCSCQACHYTWGPQYFMHLAAVLECPLPEGVLE
ncbi:DUF7341 domain-containing protein [Mycobacteroides abscessus]|uniref:DUF7341 domain-containing protein n=1 Tax=Mycobacteroides abscessus TaxID=36809 RepID=UPI0009CD0379|nr:hypothetical protein [Mycobacteroides abscessus]MDO3096770.1 hypothetical protein [Mycobacteroides abscessus subsp. abscessus]SLF57875.1 Uncharacterised protein [Mycobacteroides abscessus subsp. abscessus]